MMRRRLSALVALACVFVLSACAGLPTSGQVMPGLPPGDQDAVPDFSFVADPPQPGATAEQIVDGFIRAGSGPRDNWATAREYLAVDIREQWQPDAGVTIDELSGRNYREVSDSDVSLTINTTASVDETGVYQDTGGGATTLNFTLAQEDGEWRITSAPDGIVLDEGQFESVYHAYSLMYFDPTWQYLVPDMRWFPILNAATRIADALVDGHSAMWLDGAVVTAFPENVVARPAVPTVDGVAQVELTETALDLPADTLSRMQTQLDESLSGAGVTGVQMLVSGTPLNVEPATTLSTRVDARALVQTANGFGFLAGTEIEAIDGLSAAMAEVSPAAIEVNSDYTAAAVRTTEGSVVRVGADGGIQTVDQRQSIVDPTIDGLGYIWTVPADTPSAVTATAVDGETYEVAGAWPGAGAISDMQVSRDGSRVAALVSVGGDWEVWVAGITRDSAGVPQRLNVMVAGVIDGIGRDLSWLDDETVGVVAAQGETMIFVQQSVGGVTRSLAAPEGAVALAGTNQPSSVRLLSSEGALFVRRTTWVQSATGIQVLASQQGMPAS